MYNTHKHDIIEVYFSLGRIYIYGLEDPRADVVHCGGVSLINGTPEPYIVHSSVILTPEGLYTGYAPDDVSCFWGANRGSSCAITPGFVSGQDNEVAFQVRNAVRETGWHEFRVLFCGVTHKVKEIYIGKCPSWVSPRTEKNVLDYAKIYGKYNRRAQAFECIWE